MEHGAIARPRPLIVAHLLLALAEEPRHGYELAEGLRASGFEPMTASTVYRELARLEDAGLVRSFWQASQTRGPARHMYDLTEAGKADLAACAGDVEGLIGHLGEFLSRWACVHATAAVDVEPEPVEAPPAVGADADAAARRRGGLRLWKPH